MFGIVGQLPQSPWLYEELHSHILLCFLRGLQKEEHVLLTHGDSVDKVADGFKVVAQSGNIIAGRQTGNSRFFHVLNLGKLRMSAVGV